MPRLAPYGRATTRREFLEQAGGGLGTIALASLLSGEGRLHASESDSVARPLAAKPSHEAPGHGA